MEQELNQEEATEEATSPATSIDEKATSEKVRTEDEFRKLQSMKDKAVAEADSSKQYLQSVQGEVQQLQYQIEQQRLEAQRRELEALEGDPDGQKVVRQRQALAEERRQFDQDTQLEIEGRKRKQAQAEELTEEYNLTPKQFRELMTSESRAHMIDKAKLLGKEPVATQPPKTDFIPDSGTTDAGGDSDDAFLKRWNAGDIPTTKESIARAQKIISK